MALALVLRPGAVSRFGIRDGRRWDLPSECSRPAGKTLLAPWPWLVLRWLVVDVLFCRLWRSCLGGSSVALVWVPVSGRGKRCDFRQALSCLGLPPSRTPEWRWRGSLNTVGDVRFAGKQGEEGHMDARRKQ